MSASAVTPANQARRILILRVGFLLVLPVLLFAQPMAQGRPALMTALFVLGTLLIVAAVLGRFWAILYIGSRKNRQVMQDGPYSICRHPLYFFSTLGALGFALALGSVVLALGFAALTLAVLQATAGREEAFLRATFGPDYDAYAARVPRILPRPGLFRTPAEVTFSVAALRNNLFDALVFLAGIPAAAGLNLLKAQPWWPGFPLP